MEIVRTGSYLKALKRLKKLGAKAGDLDSMEAAIIANPQVGDVIKGTGGLRKARFAYGGAGRRGGGRTVYYALAKDGVVYLLTAYAKVDREDLTSSEKRLFSALIKELLDG